MSVDECNAKSTVKTIDTSAAKFIGEADKNETRVDVFGSVKDG